jgi:hypothetical protein
MDRLNWRRIGYLGIDLGIIFLGIGIIANNLTYFQDFALPFLLMSLLAFAVGFTGIFKYLITTKYSAKNPSQRKSKSPLVLAIAAIALLIVVLFVPIIPYQQTNIVSGNKNFPYSQESFEEAFTIQGVYVTNEYSIGGIFTVQMAASGSELVYENGEWMNMPYPQASTQSADIGANSTYTFYCPSSWNWQYVQSINYYVTPPSIPYSYSQNMTGYESIISAIIH